MDFVLCIFFGLLAAGITTSLFENNPGMGLKFILLAGTASGAVASLTGLAGGWSDMTLFNLYNVFISMALATIATGLYYKVVSKRSRIVRMPQSATAE